MRWIRKRTETLRNLLLVSLLTILLFTQFHYTFNWSQLTLHNVTQTESRSDNRLYFETEKSYKLRLQIQDKLLYGSHLKQIAEKQFNSREGYNESFLDALPLLRNNIPDFRPTPYCTNRTYTTSNTSVSVIINYHNELLSLVLRSLYTVLAAIPPHNLHEVILIDDGSDLASYHELREVEPLVSELDVDVKFYRWEDNKGLIYSRRWAAQHATGRAVLVLDSHVEVRPGFLGPLLALVDKNYKSVVAPVFDFWETFDHRDGYISYDGNALGFDRYLNWIFVYNPKDGRNFPTPAILGGAFLASKKFLEEIDYFGRGMVGWGYENIELGLKTWMCGGIVHYVPCSRVLHHSAQRSPISHGDRIKASHPSFNGGLVIKSYFSEEHFKEFEMITKVNSSLSVVADIIAANKEMLARNQCMRDYGWVRRNLMFFLESYDKETSVAHVMETQGKCVTVHLQENTGGNQDDVFLESCSTPKIALNVMRLTIWGDLRIFDRRCLDWGYPAVKFATCHMQGGNQITRYDKATGQISNISEDLCLGKAEGSSWFSKGPCERDAGQSREFTVFNFQFRTVFNRTMLVGGLALFDTPPSVKGRFH
ncbi:hypothetical protein ACHWQZ_G007109 [Mnemiopsis leidyi]